MPADAPVLLVSDHVAGAVHLLTVPDGAVAGRLTGRHLSEHAGFLALPGGRVACVDDRRGELLVLNPYAPGNSWSARFRSPCRPSTSPATRPAADWPSPPASAGTEHRGRTS